jgi:hypothetical protein
VGLRSPVRCRSSRRPAPVAAVAVVAVIDTHFWTSEQPVAVPMSICGAMEQKPPSCRVQAATHGGKQQSQHLSSLRSPALTSEHLSPRAARTSSGQAPAAPFSPFFYPQRCEPKRTNPPGAVGAEVVFVLVKAPAPPRAIG